VKSVRVNKQKNFDQMGSHGQGQQLSGFNYVVAVSSETVRNTVDCHELNAIDKRTFVYVSVYLYLSLGFVQ